MKPGNRKIIDISPIVSERTAVFPGDTRFERKDLLHFEQGNHLSLSSIHTTVHIGAHADAPIHYHRDGVAIEDRDLGIYLGRCQVITVRIARGERIRSMHLGDTKITASRVLFKTESFPDPENWNSDFNSLSAELIEALASKGVKLVGIDTPSIDPEKDSVLESHQAIFRNDMAILEGVVLTHVQDGEYTLIALPLRIMGADASPVRAVLVQGTMEN